MWQFGKAVFLSDGTLNYMSDWIDVGCMEWQEILLYTIILGELVSINSPISLERRSVYGYAKQ